MNFKFCNIKEVKNISGVATFFINSDLELPSVLKEFGIENEVQKLFQSDKSFEGKSGQITMLPIAKGSVNSFMLVGIGDKSNNTSSDFENIGGKICAKVNQLKCDTITICVDFNDSENFQSSLAVDIAVGIKLKNYSFNKYFIDKESEHKLYLNTVNIYTNNHTKIADEFSDHEKIVQGALLTRDLVTEPSNVLYPETFMQRCLELEKLGIKIKTLNKDDMKALGMNALLAVAQGSEKEPYTVIMEWNGLPDNNSSKNPLVFIGKGVTFDTGGINIKPSGGWLSDMKYDMGGAGVVTGLMQSLAARKAKVHVVGAIGLAENMPSGTAQRPSDVIKSMSGQTIEVDNTDAEGRLLLADVMWYVQTKYNPKLMVDLATLTGAVVVALGENKYAGLFSNSDEISKQLLNAGASTGELLWRLPMGEFYDKQINSKIADVKNTGSGKGGGSITAAQFLKRFVKKEYNWAHIDIAGVTWDKKGTSTCPAGATGYGVRLLQKFIIDNYELR